MGAPQDPRPQEVVSGGSWGLGGVWSHEGSGPPTLWRWLVVCREVAKRGVYTPMAPQAL